MLQIVCFFLILILSSTTYLMFASIHTPISVFLLILNCFFLLFFKKLIGPLGIFYFSLVIFLLSIISNINLFNFNLNSGSFIFVDLGRWFFSLDIITSNLILCFDNLSLILGTMVLILSVIAQIFGIEYMSREVFISRLIYLLNLFSTSVIFLFMVYDFFLILIAWELIGLFSFLLVNFYSLTIYTLKSSLKTFIFSRLSDFFIFFSFNICVLVYNTTDLSIIFLKTPFFLYNNVYIFNISLNILELLTVTVSLASTIKAAQFGFHVWLPDAMNAPTPASSLIHSSTLVIMGVYLIIRFNLIFEFTQIVNYFLIILGSLTISVGSIVAVFQTDVKKLVAYSTISQMGYLVAGCGFCAYEETVIYLIMHALNKAFLFIIVGYVVHFYNSNTDMRLMGNLVTFSPDLTVYFLKVSINLIGLPYSSGFYSKEFLLFQIFDMSTFSVLIKSLWIVSFIFTPMYMFILIYFINFNIKKNNFHTYFNINTNAQVYNINTFTNVLRFFDLSYVTSKSTSYILLLFFIIFNSLGDYVFLLLINNLSQYDSFFLKNYFIINLKYYYSISVVNTLFLNKLYLLIIYLNILSLQYLSSCYYKNLKNIYLLYIVIDFILICLLFILL